MRRALTANLVFALLLTLGAPGEASAQSAEPAEEVEGAGEVKEETLRDRVRSVQNKSFIKDGRFELAPVFGQTFNDPFKQKYMLGAEIGYHITEAMGVQVAYFYMMNADTGTKVVQAAGGNPAEVQELVHNVSADFLFTPFYGKLSVFSEWIITFDMYLIAGLGALSEDLDTLSGSEASKDAATSGADATPLSAAGGFKVAFNVGVGFRFFATDWFSLKVEGRDYIYSTQLEQFGGTTDIQNQFAALLGASFWLPPSFDRQ